MSRPAHPERRIVTDSTDQGRPDMLPAKTYHFVAHVNSATSTAVDVLLTVTEHEGHPYEVFLQTKVPELMEHMTALTLLISRMLRAGFDLEVIAYDLTSIHSAFTGHLQPGGYCPSLAAHIGQKLLEHAHASGPAPATDEEDD